LMVLVALAFVRGWQRRSHTALRWFWAGAGIWAVGVALKSATAVLANRRVLAVLDLHFSHAGYLALGSLYIGLLTGIFEIGLTLLAARIWHSLTRDGRRAVAVGVGAGSFEALLLGLSAIVSVIVMAAMPGQPQIEAARAALASSVAMTPLVWLAGPVERAMAILCHTSSRALVLMSVAKRRWSLFWYGFLIMTGIDGMAGYFHMTGAVGRISTWWIELSLLPFAALSVPIIGWCLRHWPAERNSVAETPTQATP